MTDRLVPGQLLVVLKQVSEMISVVLVVLIDGGGSTHVLEERPSTRKRRILVLWIPSLAKTDVQAAGRHGESGDGEQ